MRLRPMLALASFSLACGSQGPPETSGRASAGQGDAKTPSSGDAKADPKEPLPEPPERNDIGHCNSRDLTTLTQALASADLRTHPDVVSRGLADACQMPPFLVHYFEMAHQPKRAGSPIASADLPAYQVVLQNACPNAQRVMASMKATVPAYRTTKIFDGCQLDRFGLVDRDRYLARRPSSVLPFVTYQWLLDQGIEQQTARPIAQAVELFDRQEFGPFESVPGLQLPRLTTPADPISVEPTLYLSPNELRYDGKSLATLEGGRLATGSSPRIDALADALAEPAKKARALAESRNKVWDGRVVVVADAQTPSKTMVSVLFTAVQAGYPRSALAVESGTFEWGVVPLAGPTTTPTTAPELQVHIESAGFEISVADSTAPAGLVGLGTAKGHDAWNYDALAQAARDHRQAHPTAHSATLMADDDIPIGVLVRSIAAVRGCTSKNDCVLPDVAVASAPAP